MPWAVMGVVLFVALAVGSLRAGPPATMAERVDALAAGIRCPQCAGQSVADSGATIAVQMRAKIRELAERGRSDTQIYDYFVAGYGESVLLSPPTSGLAVLVWVIPAVAVVSGVVAVGAVFVSRRRGDARETGLLMSRELVERLDDRGDLWGEAISDRDITHI